MTADFKIKQKVHFSLYYGLKNLTACGADLQSGFSSMLKITNYRNRVTCKSCKKNRRFKKIKC